VGVVHLATGETRAAMGMQIEQGQYGKVKLDALRCTAIAAWPGLSNGQNGHMSVSIDVVAEISSDRGYLQL